MNEACADAETQAPPDRRLRRLVQPKAVQVTGLLDLHRLQLCSLPRSLHRSVVCTMSKTKSVEF